MAQYDRNNNSGDRNDFGRRSDNRYDRYATERASNRDASNPAYNDRSQYQSTGDWRDDERHSRGERTSDRNEDRGFFERAADEVTSWFSSDDDRNNDRDRNSYRSTADRDREEYYARRYNTEGARGSAGRERDYNSTFDTRYGQNVEENRLSHTNQDDTWRSGRDNTASWSSADSSRYERNASERNTPERFSRDQPDGREAGRDYYNRLNQDLRSGAGRDQGSNSSAQYRNQSSQSSPYAQSGSTYGSYGRSGSGSDSSRYGSTYGSSYNSGSNWSNQSGTYGDNSGSYGSSSYGSSSYGSSSRGEHSGKGPKGWRRSDDRVKEDVCEYLERSASIDASDVDVTVAEGVVTLTGTVPDRQMKRMCEDEIENLSGVKDVNNQLRVNRESSSNNDSSSRSTSSVNSSGSSFGTSNSGTSGSTMGSDGASNTGMSASSSNGNGSSSSTSRTDSSSNSSKKSGSSVS